MTKIFFSIYKIYQKIIEYEGQNKAIIGLYMIAKCVHLGKNVQLFQKTVSNPLGTIIFQVLTTNIILF